MHKSGKKDLSFLEISLQIGWRWVCVVCRWWQEELWCSGAVQEDEGMEQLLIAGFVHCPAASGWVASVIGHQLIWLMGWSWVPGCT